MRKRGIIAGFVAVSVVFGFTAFAYARVELRTVPSASRSAVTVRDMLVERRARYAADEILVKFRGEEYFSRVRTLAGENVSEALSRYQGRGDVVYAEPNYIAHALFVPNDPLYSPYQWHLDNPVNGGIHMEDAWNISNGAGATVAVIDTGVAYEDKGRFYKRAPDLANTSFVSGYDFVNNDSHPNDDEGHGTHVAGTIAQSTNNSKGVAGVAYGASIMPIKVLNSAGSGTYADIADGIRFAADNGADVINMSLGGSSGSQTLEDALAYAYNKGVTIVAAAGNDGTNNILYPAAYDAYVIAVGATRFDENRAPYSNYGAGLDIVAPGGDMNVDQNGDSYGDGVVQQTFAPRCSWFRCYYDNFGYYLYQGTSMATPHVAGVAALVIANGNASIPDGVRAVLEGTADDLGSAGWDSTYGWGLLNAAAALGGTAPPPPPPPPDEPPSVTLTNPSAGATVSGTVSITADASDDNGVTKVEFYVDGGLIGTDTAAPYETSWDSATASNATHTVSVTAFDTASQSASDSVGVTVDNASPPPPPPNSPPVADAGPDQSAETGVSVSFDGSGSTDDGTIVSYNWDFGDGATSTGASTSHTYSVAGTYTVMLTVTDDGGLTDSDTAIAAITEAPPPPGGPVEVFADSFEISEWNGLWTEDSQNDWYRSDQRATNGSYSAEVDGRAKNAALISIPIDLQGRNNATVNFSWLIEKSLDRNEYLAFDILINGGSTWMERARLRGNIDAENVWHDVSIDVTGINELQVRFRGTMNKGKEDADVDNVVVTAW